MNDRQLGEQLAAALATQLEVSPGQVIAVLHDLLGTDLSLLAPLKDLVSRPGFQALEASRGGHGSSQAQREALLYALGETYHPKVVERLGVFLNGYLGDSAALRSAANIQRPAPPPTPTEAVGEIVMIGEREDPTTAPALGGAASPSPCGDGAPLPLPLQRRGQWRPLLASGTAAALALAAVAGLRANILCSPVGLCSAASIEASATALEEARKAAATLETATDLGAYERALGSLNRQLNRIASSAGLSEAQRQSRKVLQAQAERALGRLKQEMGYRQRLQQAAAEWDAIGRLARKAGGKRLTALRQQLEEIPADSLVARESEQLLRKLEPTPAHIPDASTEPGELPQAQPSSAEPVPAPSPPPRWQASSSESAPRREPPVRSEAPAPSPRTSPPSPEDGGGSNAPYRPEPLW